MRTSFTRRQLAFLASLVALPAASAAPAAPTAFETFATHPDTVVAAQREVGSLTSLDSTITVTVLVAAARVELSLTAIAEAAHPRGGNSVVGTEGCWMPNPVERILCPELQQAPAWTGLRIWTFGGGKTFEFRDRTVVDLREFGERAVTELNEL